MTSSAYGSFRAVSYPLRLYSGEDALSNLGAELDRERQAAILSDWREAPASIR